uniref:Uncharacterized protein n=1 Tax=Eutreptiella gymnastica TaxID=73025 RepID=A0A7S4FNE8_9EUGL
MYAQVGVFPLPGTATPRPLLTSDDKGLGPHASCILINTGTNLAHKQLKHRRSLVYLPPFAFGAVYNSMCVARIAFRVLVGVGLSPFLQKDHAPLPNTMTLINRRDCPWTFVGRSKERFHQEMVDKKGGH